MALCGECMYMSGYICVGVYIDVQYTQKHINIWYTCIFINILVFQNESNSSENKTLIGVNDNDTYFLFLAHLFL